jgi:lysyl-tRNA synthetase class 2
MGRVAFLELRDTTGTVQLFCGRDFTERYADLIKVSLGDWIHADGEVVRTARGELSVKVLGWTRLAEAQHGFGDKWHGVSDPDFRYRHREIDLWARPESRDVLLVRSRMIQSLRRRLWADGFIEVETPMLHPILGGASARPFVTHHQSLHSDFYLRIAPELYLKRLVVGGIERVFEIGRVFRNEGMSPRHNPEFTMLELYQAYADYHELMDLTESLILEVASQLRGGPTAALGDRVINMTPPWRRASLHELVGEAIGVALTPDSPVEVLLEAAASSKVPVQDGASPGKVLLELYEKLVEPELIEPTFVTDHPVEVSPLAKRRADEPRLTERFELVVGGRELVNAFSELTDPQDQRARFESQMADRAAGDQEAMMLDEDYLMALENGLPPTGGLGLGIDRLAMLMTGAVSIKEVIAFLTMAPRP